MGTTMCSHALLPNSPSLWAASWKGGSLSWGHDTSGTAYSISPQPLHVSRIESDPDVLALAMVVAISSSFEDTLYLVAQHFDFFSSLTKCHWLLKQISDNPNISW